MYRLHCLHSIALFVNMYMVGTLYEVFASESECSGPFGRAWGKSGERKHIHIPSVSTFLRRS